MKLQQRFLLEEQYSIFPHLSMEDPPWSEEICYDESDKNINFLSAILNKMTLIFYKVTLQAT